MEANAAESFQMQMLFNIFPRISLHCKLVPVQYCKNTNMVYLDRKSPIKSVSEDKRKIPQAVFGVVQSPIRTENLEAIS